jgi:diacylglycerol kinase family enzyme
MRITGSNGTIEDNINLFLVLNSSGTGGIGQLVPDASVNDGVFDFLGFRNDLIKDTPKLLLSFLKGEYLDDKGIIYFRDNDIKIENLDPNNRFSVTDCDGEVGPEMPVEIKNIPKAIKIFVKEN